MDFQRFEKNAALADLIAETEGRYAKALSEDELEFVSAAGDPLLENKPQTPGEGVYNKDGDPTLP